MKFDFVVFQELQEMKPRRVTAWRTAKVARHGGPPENGNFWRSTLVPDTDKGVVIKMAPEGLLVCLFVFLAIIVYISLLEIYL